MTDNLKTPSPRERILEAVITCIEKEGINNLTTRSIASEAGTNVASINYYFRTKDALVSEALSMSVNHMLEDVIAILADRTQPFEQRIEDVIFYLVDGAFTFPGVFMAHLYSPVVERRYDTVGAKAMMDVFHNLIEHAVLEFPNRKAEDVRLIMYQTFSGILFTMLSPGFLQELLPFQLADGEDRKKYTKYVAHLTMETLRGESTFS